LVKVDGSVETALKHALAHDGKNDRLIEIIAERLAKVAQ
jgi:hypothetical protein